jgi:hypothetical protein
MRRFACFALLAACSTVSSAPDAARDVAADLPSDVAADLPHDVALDVPPDAPLPDVVPPAEPARDIAMFHGNRARHGWYARESALTPERVRAGFGPAWSTAPFATATVDGREWPAHVYATPLYLDRLAVTAGDHRGRVVRAAFAATSNADVYAVCVEAIDGGAPIAPGTVLWRRRLTTPALADLDGRLPLGVLATPVIDASASPPVMYVTSMDAAAGWQAFALDLGAGDVRPGWPLTLDAASVGAVNTNGPARFAPAPSMAQRGALALSLDGATLYVPFGTYGYAAPGWMVAVDTRGRRVARSFASAPSLEVTSAGGMWASGGPAIDDEGRVYMTTGNDARQPGASPGAWGSSLLRWRADLSLEGTYTPFNYCVLDAQNMDLGGSGPMLLPAQEGARTPRLVVFGGKQGVAYLLDRDRLPGTLSARPACLTDASRDPSLLNPAPQAQWGTRGPLLLFPPYTERYGQYDHARMRTTPALFRDEQGVTFAYFAGSSRPREEDATPVPPGLARLRVVAPADAPAHLALDARESETTLLLPGSAVVTSDGPRAPVVWVLDANQPRSAPLTGASVARPMLYAFDGLTLARLWQTPAGALEVGGKYASPAVARGAVLVATDRLRALTARPPARCAAGTLLSEGFDNDAAGGPFARGWTGVAMAERSAVRVSNDAEGEGDRSARYVILTNNAAAGRATLHAESPTLDASGCEAATVEVSVIAFSMEEGEMDAAWVEARGNGWDWVTLERVFPSRHFGEDITCRPGRQSTGCTRWVTLRYELPRALVGAGLQVRLRANTHTTASDAMGLDRVTVTAR